MEISLAVIQNSLKRGVHNPILELQALVALRIRSKKFSPLCFNLDIQ